MTLEESIKRYNSNAFYEKSDGNLQGCLEFRQLAEWLKELEQLREQTRWTPVSERLPKEGGDYLITISLDIGAKEPIREVYKDFFCVLSQKWLYHDEDVIAWMPLPIHYKTESEVTE